MTDIVYCGCFWQWLAIARATSIWEEKMVNARLELQPSGVPVYGRMLLGTEGVDLPWFHSRHPFSYLTGPLCPKLQGHPLSWLCHQHKDVSTVLPSLALCLTYSPHFPFTFMGPVALGCGTWRHLRCIYPAWYWLLICSTVPSPAQEE